MKKIKTYESFLGGEQKSLLPEPSQTELRTYKFKVPVKVQLDFDESILSWYSSIDEIARKIEQDYGVDTYWLTDQFNSWKEYKAEDPGEEPDIDDFDDEDDYEAEMEEWNERKDEFDKVNDADDTDLLDDYVKDEFGDWSRFLNEFETDVRINESDLDMREQKEIFDVLKDDFNDADLVQYFDEAEKLGVADMKVAGNNFDDEGRFYVEVRTSKELSDEELAEIEDYISGQCSDGWGEGFEQQETGESGWSVSAWWGDDNKFGEYKIEIEK